MRKELLHFLPSYKNFKVRFFKVIILPNLGDNHFFDVNKKPLFPFYWQRVLRRYDDYPEDYLTDQEHHNLTLMNKLSRRLSTKPLVSIFKELKCAFSFSLSLFVYLSNVINLACFIAILKFVGMDALNFANMCREVGVTVWNASMTWPFDPLPPPRPSPRDVVPLADKKEEEKE